MFLQARQGRTERRMEQKPLNTEHANYLAASIITRMAEQPHYETLSQHLAQYSHSIVADVHTCMNIYRMWPEVISCMASSAGCGGAAKV